MKYKIPCVLVIEVDDDGGTIRVLSDTETFKLQQVVIDNLKYLLSDMDFLYDSIQERLPGDLCLTSLSVEGVKNEEMPKVSQEFLSKSEDSTQGHDANHQS